MQKIASSDTASTAACSADRDEASEFKPLTREEAQVWRSSQKPFSPWRVVVWQALAVSGLRCAGCGVAIGVVGAWHVAYDAPTARQIGHGGACVLGAGQNSPDDCFAVCSAQSGATPGLAGFAGGFCGDDESVLVDLNRFNAFQVGQISRWKNW